MDGLSHDDFAERLKNVIYPVYNAAHECGFDWNWKYMKPIA